MSPSIGDPKVNIPRVGVRFTLPRARDKRVFVVTAVDRLMVRFDPEPFPDDRPWALSHETWGNPAYVRIMEAGILPGAFEDDDE